MQRYFATLRDWEWTDGELLARSVVVSEISNRPSVVPVS